MLLVRIHIPAEDRTKTVKVKADESVTEVTQHIHLATKIAYEEVNPWQLFFPGSPPRKLDVRKTLAELGVSKLDTLEFRRDPSVPYQPLRRRGSTPTMDALLLANDGSSRLNSSPRVPARKDRQDADGPHRRTKSIDSPRSSLVLTAGGGSGAGGITCATVDIAMLKKKSSSTIGGAHHGSKRLIYIEMPETQTRRGLKVSLDDTLEDVLTQFTKKTRVPNLGDYCLFLVEEELSSKDGVKKIKLDRRKLVRTLDDKITLVLERTQVKVLIRFSDKETELILVESPNTTASELSQRICKIGTRKPDLVDVVAKPSKYCLYLPNKSGTGGTKLELSRTLQSYRMTDGDFLLWTSKASVKSGLSGISKRSKTRSELFIKIELVDDTHTKGAANTRATLKVKTSMTIADVISLFIKKHPVEHSDQYALYVEEKGKKSPIQLDVLRKVEDYSESIGNLCTLTLRRREEFTRPHHHHHHHHHGGGGGGAEASSMVRSQSEETSAFGGQCITTDTYVECHGYRIPNQLARLRASFDALGGRESVGIFRLAGDEEYMHVLKKHFGSEEGSEECKVANVDDVATLIKRWIGSLPKKPFGELISGEHFEACKRREEEALLKIPEVMPQPYKDIFLWLVDLLLDVASNEPVNKMTTQNLAVVMTPALTHAPRDNPILALTITGFAVAIFQRYLELAMKQRNS